MAARDDWWREGVLYQVYVRSFRDADGDGTGDLRGVIERLGHLTWLGVDGIWLSPIHPSPNRDWGYDVADYRAVHEDLGRLDDLDELVRRAGDRGIHVLLDLVPNHTSDRHPWFLDARTSRDARHRDRYVWADPARGGGPPNNWTSTFGGPAWTYDEPTAQWYLHNFLPEQPDLNWWEDEVRDEFDAILRFWFDRGVSGFRIDVAHAIVKDRDLRDNVAPPPAADPERAGQRLVFNMHRPEVHDVLRRWRAIADAYDPPRILLGETWALDHADLARYYGEDGEELHLAFNFPFAQAPFRADDLRLVVETTERELDPEAWPVWTASNHDIGRLATRWCGGDPRKIRLALLVLLMLRGTPVLYQGDEIGLPEIDVPPSRRRDTAHARRGSRHAGRDRGRTPMPWTPAPGGGFSPPGVEPWLPLGEPGVDVATQREDPTSTLSWARRLIGLRRERADLRTGAAG
ncbi:MAG TPA: alpha-amylase family glycosyl hydrolase, partial [Actinomycetota bacterium]